ncbi:MAG: hypothetical protein L0Y64_09395, partial [Myxococcaceae bacterium]|nr:hypothetical protein [Myxococcaceae bacterium]
LVGLVDPVEKGCRSCHDASSPSLAPFDFRTALKAIDHWSKDRLERVEPQAAPRATQASTSAGTK